MGPTFQKNDLMSVLESIADAVVKLDGRANYMAMNRAAAEIFRRLGRDPEQIIGKSVWQVFPEIKGTVVERKLREVVEEDISIRYDFYYPGDKRWYETQGYPSSPGAILIFRDVTSLKTASSQSAPSDGRGIVQT